MLIEQDGLAGRGKGSSKMIECSYVAKSMQGVSKLNDQAQVFLSNVEENQLRILVFTF